MKTSFLLLFLLVGTFLVSFISAYSPYEFGYGILEVDDFGYNTDGSGVPPGNYSINVNNTIYHQGYTVATLWDYFKGLGNLIWASSSDYVPYTGATNNVDLGVHNFSTLGRINAGEGLNISSGNLYVMNNQTTTVYISSGVGNENATIEFQEENAPRASIEYSGRDALLRIWSKYADGVENVLMSFNVMTNLIEILGDLNIGNNLNVTGNVHIDGNVSMKRPYLNAYDNTTQNFLSTANAQLVNISNIEDNYLVNIVGKTNITFQQTGDYLLTFSPEFYQSSGTNKIITFWIRKNGVDVPWSNSRFTIINQQYMAPSITYQVDIENPLTDTIQFVWYSDSTNTQLVSVESLINPTRPSIPSVLLNVLKISEVTD